MLDFSSWQSHESRSLDTNRATARLKLQEQLDIHIHGEDSILMKEKAKLLSKKKAKRSKSSERLEKKKAFKEREGLT
jgi:hypothetical protein